MTKNSGLLSNPLVLGIGGFVIGLLVGWLLLNAIYPSPLVRFTNVDPVDLKQEYKQQWIVDVADAYASTQDLTSARNHLRWFTPEEIQQSLRFAFTERNTKSDAEGAARIASFAQVYGLDLASSGQSGTAPTTPKPATGGLFDSAGQLLIIVAVILLLAAAGLFLYMRIKGGDKTPKAQPAAATAATAAAGGTTSYARPEPVTTTVTAPTGLSDEPAFGPGAAAAPAAARAATSLAKSLGTFAATYKFGEDNYDTSFTLETARGEFLGETGMGSSETIGEGKPDKVTAFDIWLFDKTDVRTVTQILMSEAAYNDQATRQRLATKGELVLAEKGKHVRLETATLAVDCEIVDLVYASTPGLPPNSHFQKLIVEMVPTQK